MMKKVFNNFLFLFLIILISFFVVAEPPFQVNEITEGLTVIYPHNGVYKDGEIVDFDIHVANSSGFILLNTDFDCNLHLFHPNGSHSLKTSLNNAGSYDENILLNDTIVDEGVNPYLVWCNSSQGEYGFVNGQIRITNSGVYNEVDVGVKWLSILLALFGMTSIMLFITTQIKDKLLKPVKIVFFVISVINGLLLGVFAYMISLNPYDVTSYRPLGLAYASINVFLIMGFIFNYAFVLLARIYKRSKDKWVNSFKGGVNK